MRRGFTCLNSFECHKVMVVARSLYGSENSSEKNTNISKIEEADIKCLHKYKAT